MRRNHKYSLYQDRLPSGTWRDIKVWECKEDEILAKLGYDVKPLFTLPDQPNGITTEGINYLLEVGFRSDAGSPVAQLAPWYAGLIDNSGYTGVAAADTMSSHSGWSEITTQYDESVRQTLAFAAASSRQITASVSFTMNATKTVQGIFVVSNSTKGGTTGTLFSTALFSSPPSLISGNVLTANYTLSD